MTVKAFHDPSFWVLVAIWTPLMIAPIVLGIRAWWRNRQDGKPLPPTRTPAFPGGKDCPVGRCPICGMEDPDGTAYAWSVGLGVRRAHIACVEWLGEIPAFDPVALDPDGDVRRQLEAEDPGGPWARRRDRGERRRRKALPTKGGHQSADVTIHDLPLPATMPARMEHPEPVGVPGYIVLVDRDGTEVSARHPVRWVDTPTGRTMDAPVKLTALRRAMRVATVGCTDYGVEIMREGDHYMNTGDSFDMTPTGVLPPKPAPPVVADWTAEQVAAFQAQCAAALPSGRTPKSKIMPIPPLHVDSEPKRGPHV